MTQTVDSTRDTTSPPVWAPLAAVAVTLLLWSSAFVAIRHLGHDFSAGALSLGRLAVGAIVLAAFALPRGLPRPTARQWRSIVVIGLLWYAVYMVALNEGEQRVDAGTAAMLIQVSPVLIAVLAALFLSERFTVQLTVGLALAFSGVAVIALSGDSSGTNSDLVGVLLCLVAAVVYSVSVVIQKPLVAKLSSLHVTWLACTVGALACLPFAGTLVSEVGDAAASSVWWMVYLGVFPTAIAFTTYGYALQHMTASSLGVTTYVVPVITIVMSLVLLDEVPPPMAYLGGALALVGVAVARRTARTRPTPPT
ncbi:DMT family transporter [Nocardioides sp.]|uniref:DMT family transporter n=1 Tax=Nocardioides sp. TaxID=35761 RepID=UPI002B26A146|nr:DMT family transporter [Nocardioides sp.]